MSIFHFDGDQPAINIEEAVVEALEYEQAVKADVSSPETTPNRVSWHCPTCGSLFEGGGTCLSKMMAVGQCADCATGDPLSFLDEAEQGLDDGDASVIDRQSEEETLKATLLEEIKGLETLCDHCKANLEANGFFDWLARIHSL